MGNELLMAKVLLNDELPNTNDEIMNQHSNSKQKYDLEERTMKFGKAVIGFAKKISVTPVTKSLIDQMVRAGTSVGANYCEANDSTSRKERAQ